SLRGAKRRSNLDAEPASSHPNDESALVTAVELLPRLLAVLGLDDADLALARPFALAAPLDDAERRHLLALARRASPAVLDEPEAALGELLSEWLRFYGPLEREVLASIWQLDRERLVPLLEELVDAERI